MMIISPDQHRKLKAILARLDSSHEGEVIAAINVGRNLLASAGLRFSDLVIPALPSSAPQVSHDPAFRARQRPEPVHTSAGHQRTARVLLASGYPWNDWERKFLRSISNFRQSLSTLQRQKLADCVADAQAWGGSDGSP